MDRYTSCIYISPIKNAALLILTLLLSISCTKKSKTDIAETQLQGEKIAEYDFEFVWNAELKIIQDLDDEIKRLSDSLALEFVYPMREKILENDSLIIVQKLKKRGFRTTDWGRGNWLNGPRAISYTLESNDMICRVQKLYYSDSIVTQDGKYKVTERLACLLKK